MFSHRKPAINAVPKPFTVNEDGRLKKTQVEDHIIQRRKHSQAAFEKQVTQQKEKNQEAFISYLLAKRAEAKEMKRLQSLHFGNSSKQNSKASRSKEASKKYLEEASEQQSESDEEDIDNHENQQIIKEV